MKKVLLVALATLGGVFLYRQVRSARAKQDPWAEVVDTLKSA